MTGSIPSGRSEYQEAGAYVYLHTLNKKWDMYMYLTIKMESPTEVSAGIIYQQFLNAKLWVTKQLSILFEGMNILTLYVYNSCATTMSLSSPPGLSLAPVYARYVLL